MESNSVPYETLGNVREFFELVSEAINLNVPRDPAGSMKAFAAASHAACVALNVQCHAPAVVRGILKSFADFVQHLNKPRALNEAEVRTVFNLRKFFMQMETNGKMDV